MRIVSDTGASFNVLSIIAGTGVLVENLSIDYGFEQRGHLGMRFRMDDKIEIHDVHFVGFNPSENSGGRVNLSTHITDPSGVAVVDGLVRVGPTELRPHRSKTNDPNPMGVIWMGKNHEGTVHIRNSHIENSGENGVYASRTRGVIHYENCLFRNNNMSAIRIGGGKGTHTVRGCVFEVDTDNPNTSDNVNDFINPGGPVVETNNVDAVPVEFIDCDFHWISAPARGNLILVGGNAGPVDFTNCRGRSETSSSILTTRTDPRWHVAADDQTITITDSHLTGQGGVRLVKPDSDGHRQVTVDGGCVSAPLDPEVTVSDATGTQQCDLPSGSGSAGSEEPTDSTTVQELVVRGSGDGRSDYRIRYDGTASTDERTEGDDTAADGVIEGSVWGSSEDDFQLEGSVLEIVELTNDATVTLDGERIDTGT